MRSTFGGMETAVRALRTNQLALQVTGQNISNADTPGYSRQIPVISATAPYSYPGLNRSTTAGQIGTGVDVQAILRMRDDFLDYQIQDETSLKGLWGKRQETLEHLEVIFNEPSDSGISARMNQLWDSLHELAYRSDDSSVRSAVREDAVVFAETITHTYKQLTDLQLDLNKEISVVVGKVNTLARQIADLNEVISKVQDLNQAPNDLMDQRELLVQDLAKLVNINVHTDASGRYNISISGAILVAGDYASPLTTKRNIENRGMVDIVWEANGSKAAINNGELQGLLEMRDQELGYYIKSLNSFASTLITQFNAVHQSGYGLQNSTNIRFFSGTDASDIGIDSEIMANLNNIAASVNVATPPNLPTGAPGNGENALNLTKILSNDKLMSGGSTTLTQFYNGLIAKLGVDGEKANTTSQNQDTLINYLKDRQESIAGVSLDEEMANMMKYQNAYNASSRFLNTLDELLDTLIKGTGMVGR